MIGLKDCPECDSCGFSDFTDRYGTVRMAPCATCRPDDRAKCDLDHDFGPPTRFAGVTGQIHDVDAHKRDRAGGGWPTCDRCIELCVAFHDQHNIGHLVPLGLRRRVAEIADALLPVPEEIR